MSYNRQHLFITGATGFFGRSLLRHMDALERVRVNPWRVTAMTRSKEKFLLQFPEFSRMPWLHFHEGDILSGEWSFRTNIEVSHVLHAATDSTPPADFSALARLDQIVTGTRNALEFAKQVNAKRFLLTSSGDVYGPQPSDMAKIPETFTGSPDSFDPRNSYGCGKRLAEHLCALYAAETNLEFVVARCFSFVGPDLPLDAHFAIGNFIHDALMGAEFLITGDGTPIRSYLYQEDLAAWLLKILTHGHPNSVYNVGSDQEVSIAQLAQLVRHLLAPSKPITMSQKTPPQSEARRRYVPDLRRAREELQLEISVPLDKAILKTAYHLISNNCQLKHNP